MDPRLNARQGKVRGGAARGVDTFKGGVCAAPPFGADRLGLPQLAKPRRGVRGVLTRGPTPPLLAAPPASRLLLTGRGWPKRDLSRRAPVEPGEPTPRERRAAGA